MIEAGLYSLLSTTAAITAICSTRIYPDPFPPDTTYPAITYKIISNVSGPTLSTSGMQRMRIEFHCRSSDALQASIMRETLRRTLEGYNGVLTDGTFLQDAQLINQMDGYADESRVFIRMIEMYLFFNFSS